MGFKSYEHFTEQVDFAYWRSCIGKGLRAACVAVLFIKYFWHHHVVEFQPRPILRETLGMLFKIH